MLPAKDCPWVVTIPPFDGSAGVNVNSPSEINAPFALDVPEIPVTLPTEPFVPFMPLAPAGPIGPCAPISPGIPWSPLAPTTPNPFFQAVPSKKYKPIGLFASPSV